MGSGKTKTSTEIYRLKCIEHKRLLRALIICPIAVLENWKREILTHSYIKESSIQIIDGVSPVNPRDKELKNPSKKIFYVLLGLSYVLLAYTHYFGLATILFQKKLNSKD